MMKLTKITIVSPSPEREVQVLARIHRCTTRTVYYALRGDSASRKALAIRNSAIRRGHAVDTGFYSDGTRKEAGHE